MSDFSGFQDLVDAIRNGFRDVRYDGISPRVSEGQAPVPAVARRGRRARPRQGRRISGARFATAAFVLTAAALIPIALLLNNGPNTVGGAATASTSSTMAPSALPPLTWPPLQPDIAAPEGASWLCPPSAPQADTILDAEAVPDEIRFVPSPEDGLVDAAWGVDYGPTCGRPPALVAVDFTDESRSTVDAVIVVWVEMPSSSFPIPSDGPNSFDPTVVGPEAELENVERRGGFVVRTQPATEWLTHTVEMVGMIDGLPVWVQASGIAIEELEPLVEQMTASAATGEVSISPPVGRFEVVRTQPVVASTYEFVVWYAEGVDIDVTLRRAPGFDPFASSIGFTNVTSFVSIGPSVGRFAREGESTGYLTWEIGSGVVATVSGYSSIDELVRAAERLTPAG